MSKLAIVSNQCSFEASKLVLVTFGLIPCSMLFQDDDGEEIEEMPEIELSSDSEGEVFYTSINPQLLMIQLSAELNSFHKQS